MTSHPPRRPLAATAPAATALVDVGTTNIGCLIIAADGRLLGGAHAAAAGLRGGEVFDSMAALAAIDRTLTQAEQAAQAPISDIVLSIGCGRLSGRVVQATVQLDPPIVCANDIKRLEHGLTADAERNGRLPLHQERHHFLLDGVAITGAPADRFGRRLDAISTVVCADPRPIETLVTAVEATRRIVTRLVPAPYAAALAVTTAEERIAGITVIDTGAGQTSYAMFAGGRLVAARSLAVGGQQLTTEISETLQLPLTEAERIKTNYAIDVHAPIADVSRQSRDRMYGSDTERSQFADRVLRSDDSARALLQNVIDRRTDLWLRLLSDRIDAEPFALAGARQVVLTGGAASLAGLVERAQRVWGRLVEMRGAIGDIVPQPLRGPTWAVLAGLRTIGSNEAVGVRIAQGGAIDVQRRISA